MSLNRTSSEHDRAARLRDLLVPPEPYGLILSRSGVAFVAYRDRFDWQIAREHWQVVVAYLVTRDAGDLAEFEEATVAGHELMAEPAEIERWVAGSRGGTR